MVADLRINQRELGSAQTIAGCEVRTAIINRRACDRSKAGSAKAIAWYEVRATKSNRRARNRSTLGSTVGGYLVTILKLRQLVLARSGVIKKSTDGDVGLWSIAGTRIWGDTRKEN
jgi:hypothetical protein